MLMCTAQCEKNPPGALAVSACLAGLCCRYDGLCTGAEDVIAAVGRGEAVPLCPEQLGGLPTPREPSEIEAGFSGGDVLDGKARVLTASGKDVTACYLRGAKEALKLCVLIGAKRAILKANSPSCGCGSIHAGRFDDALTGGDGVTAALLKRNGILVETK